MRYATILNYLFLCHRLPERSFFWRGHQFPICARCTGILIGYIVGVLPAIAGGKLSLGLLGLFLGFVALDGGGQYLGWWESNNPRRLITGIGAGLATDFLLTGVFRAGFTQGRILGAFFLGR